MTRFLPLIPLLLIAACTSSPPSPEALAPRPAPAPAPTPRSSLAVPPVAAAWQDWPPSAGDWVYRRDNKGSIALFGGKGGNADFMIRCTLPARKIFVSRAGGFPADVTGQMVLRATSGLKSYTAANTGDTPPYVATEIPATDPQLDALAFSRGRFIVSVKGAADLVVPPWPELAHVVEDCRT